MQNIKNKKRPPLVVLGIETSCDETSAAVVTEDRAILSHVVLSQAQDFESLGGVVPEVAARNHLSFLKNVISDVMRTANTSFDQLSGIAATAGPGLIGGLLVGTMMGKSIAAFHGKPFIAVNHLEAHVLTARLTHGLSFPYVLLLISGGHTQLVHVRGIGIYDVLGKSLDDAVGECFDKVAKMLDLPYPGGPSLEKLALNGRRDRFKFIKPFIKNTLCDFSFSGLKTDARYTLQKLGTLSDSARADIAASFEKTVADTLRHKVERSFKTVPNVKTFVVSGGVASNLFIRRTLSHLCEDYGIDFVAPPIHLCTDNGAMIAWTGIERLSEGCSNALDFMPRPKWPLTELSPTVA